MKHILWRLLGLGFFLLLGAFLILYVRNHTEKTAREKASILHWGEVSFLKFSPNGRYLVVGCKGSKHDPRLRHQGQITVWDTQISTKMAQVQTSSWVQSLALSPAGTELVVSCGVWDTAEPPHGGEMHLYLIPSLTLKDNKKVDGVNLSVRIAPDGNSMVTTGFLGSPKNVVQGKIWTFPSFKVQQEISGLDYIYGGVCYSPDGKHIAVGDKNDMGNGVVRFHHAKDGRKDYEMEVGRDVVTLIEYSPDSNRLAIFTSGGGIQIWDLALNRQVPTIGFEDAMGRGRCFSFSPDGKLFAVATKYGGRNQADATVQIWDLANQKLFCQWDWPELHVRLTAVTFSPDCRLLAVGTSKGEVKMYELPED